MKTLSRMVAASSLLAFAAFADDAEIVQTLTSANNGEITVAEIAINKANNTLVKSYAEEVRDHHSKSNEEIATVQTNESLSAKENPKSKALERENKLTVSKLKPLSGKTFDKAYVDAQVKEHQRVLNLLKTDLIPQAQNAQLKKTLQDTQPIVEAHLKKAKDLQASIQ